MSDSSTHDLPLRDPVQTGLRLDRTLLKVLRAFADYKEMSLSSLVEGLLLHGIEGKAAITDPDTLATLEQLRATYGLGLRSEHSHKGSGLD
jgi:hypothetical protein